MNTIENPWIVPSLDKFLFFCCPECENKSSDESSFVNHATAQHPLVSFFLLLLKKFHSPFRDFLFFSQYTVGMVNLKLVIWEIGIGF